MIVLSVHQNIVARIASGSNEVFLLFRWGIRVEQRERVAVGLSEDEALPVLREGEVIGGAADPLELQLHVPGAARRGAGAVRACGVQAEGR